MSVIVDVSHMFYSSILASKELVQNNQNIVAHMILNSFYSIVEKFEVGIDNPIYAAFDCKRKDNWRTKFYEENAKNISGYNLMKYKGQRVADPTIPWLRVFEILEDTKNFLNNSTDVRVVEHPHAEADDVVATLVALNRSQKKETVIWAIDKDYSQLVDQFTKIYDPKKKAYREVPDPKTFLIEHILTGDKSDNILPCRPKLGAKTAAKMSKNINAYLETADENFKQRYYFNKILIDMAEIPDDIFNEIKTTIDNHNHSRYNMMDVMKFMQKYALRNLSERGVDKLHFLKPKADLTKWM